MNDMATWQNDDEIFRRLREMIAQRVTAVGIEASIRERHLAQSQIASANKRELEYARARILDYLLHYRSWIEQDIAAAASHCVIRQCLLRGDLIHDALNTKQDNWAGRLIGVRESAVKCASGLPANWQK